MFSLDAFSLLGGDRAIRKRQQVDNIVSVLTKHGLESKSVVVDFGSGSGNLCLALASVFTLTTFVFVDMNQTSLDILSQRSRVAGLQTLSCSPRTGRGDLLTITSARCSNNRDWSV